LYLIKIIRKARHDAPEITLFFLFLFLFWVSIIALLTPDVAKQFNLAVPVYYYIGILIATHMIIVGLSFKVEIFRTDIKKLFKPPWVDLILKLFFTLVMTFFWPSFRMPFYFYIPDNYCKAVATLLFIFIFLFEIQFILFCTSKITRWMIVAYLWCLCVLIVIFSPFYFFRIILTSGTDTRTIISLNPTEIYQEQRAHNEAGRRYFIYGKQYAAKGNRAGFIKSIQFYKKTLDLLPNDGLSYAELAYSYASIAKILQDVGAEKRRIEENLKKAEDAINQAKRINHQNPTVFAVDLLIQYTIAQYYITHRREYDLSHDKFRQMKYKIERSKGDGLNELGTLSKSVGVTDKVYLAEAILTENRIKKGSSLLTILEKFDSDNAEVHNLLGLVYYLVNDKDSAKKMFERAKRLSPDFGKPYLNLALVYPKKEAFRLYTEASHRDRDLKSLASYYSNLFEVTKWLWRVYVGIVIVFVFRFFAIMDKYDDPSNPKNVQTNPEGFKKAGRLFFRCILLFIITYVSFEIYIHLIRPINGIDYMYPIGFPFF